MGNQDIYESWNKESAGVLSVKPLILKACEAGMLGQAISFPGGCIYKSMFTYLCGIPDSDFLAEHKDLNGRSISESFRQSLFSEESSWSRFVPNLPRS